MYYSVKLKLAYRVFRSVKAATTKLCFGKVSAERKQVHSTTRDREKDKIHRKTTWFLMLERSWPSESTVCTLERCGVECKRPRHLAVLKLDMRSGCRDLNPNFEAFAVPYEMGDLILHAEALVSWTEMCVERC